MRKYSYFSKHSEKATVGSVHVCINYKLGPFSQLHIQTLEILCAEMLP